MCLLGNPPPEHIPMPRHVGLGGVGAAIEMGECQGAGVESLPGQEVAASWAADVPFVFEEIAETVEEIDRERVIVAGIDENIALRLLRGDPTNVARFGPPPNKGVYF